MNRSYGSWHRATGGSHLTLDGEVAESLLAGCDDNDYSEAEIAEVAAAYRAAINAALPTGILLCGDEFYGPADQDTPDIRAIIERIDFWGIVESVVAERR